MSVSVSVCMIRFELCNLLGEDLDSSDCTMASSQGNNSKSRTRRDIREYTVETYPHKTETSVPKPLVSNSFSNRDRKSQEPDQSSSKEDCDLVNFVSGNPFVEITKGILHLYKENELTSVDKAASSQTVCILAVPASMTCHDLITFLAACQGDIKNIRVIRDSSPNQYMVLLTFRSEQSSINFYMSYNGIPFNSLEPTSCCNLVFVSHVESVTEGEAQIPPILHTELPTCPVCLERMDESVDGILTILCNHSFHGSCLSKWGDTTCPVCRYVQTPELVADNRCFECNSADSLWICLICGHVGCGRYVHGHAFKHYLDTQHCYSMQLENNRVWDYVGDNFVHRLLQNKADGKLVEGNVPGKEETTEKLDSMQLEFTYTLTSQLDSQRLYFEDLIARFEQQSLENTSKIKEELVKQTEENKNLQEKITLLKKDKVNADKKIQQLTTRLNQTQNELTEERQMSKAMQANQSAWQKKYSELEDKFNCFKSEKDKEISELKEQLRDIMFYFEAEKQVMASEQKDEIAEGHIVVGEPSSGNRAKHRRKKSMK
ncbi:BRCA1-associated protein-like [Macrosteles quadrilineatus]|uniref:BRCA1-associated protein-like n=1 Tax=Macrosteles quadrilineatus TaxID=74068 RepID=UPI0023E0C16D|nr:BRCA1-associated protein-like [Macrosteles quadrilineatus]